MKAPNWLKQDKHGTVITVEMEVKNLKDLERMERAMERFAQHLEKAANASERFAQHLEKAANASERLADSLDRARGSFV